MRVNNLRYNPATASYEGRVDIERSGHIYRYPCEVPGPMNMATATVMAAMQHQALRMSDTFK